MIDVTDMKKVYDESLTKVDFLSHRMLRFSNIPRDQIAQTCWKIAHLLTQKQINFDILIAL